MPKLLKKWPNKAKNMEWTCFKKEIKLTWRQ